MNTLPLSDVKARLSELIQQAEDDHDHFVVTKNGRPSAVVVSMAEWESIKETLDVLSEPDLIDQLREAGSSDVRYTSEDILADLAGRSRPSA